MSPFDNSVKSEAEVISTYQYNLKANNTTETSERYNKDSDYSIWLIVKIADDLKKSVTVNVVEGVDTRTPQMSQKHRQPQVLEHLQVLAQSQSSSSAASKFF